MFKKTKSILTILLISFFGIYNSFGMEREENINIPTGVINSFAGEKSPNGWLLCNGTQYSSQKYPELYEVIKTKYVPHRKKLEILEHNENNQYKLFCVPDLRGRVIVGVDGGAGCVTSNNTLGAIGGEEKHKLTVSEMPSHNHEMNLIEERIYQSGITTIGNYTTKSRSTLNSGGDQPHNNMQPYQVLNYIINTGEFNKKINIQIEKINQLEKQIEELKISQKGCAKAWVVFNGEGRILDSFGVSSVNRKEAGKFIIKFSKAFKSEFYSSSFSARGTNGYGALATALDNVFPQTRENVTFITYQYHNGVLTNPELASACFQGNI